MARITIIIIFRFFFWYFSAFCSCFRPSSTFTWAFSTWKSMRSTSVPCEGKVERWNSGKLESRSERFVKFGRIASSNCVRVFKDNYFITDFRGFEKEVEVLTCRLEVASFVLEKERENYPYERKKYFFYRFHFLRLRDQGIFMPRMWTAFFRILFLFVFFFC